MCRFLAYLGTSIIIDALIYQPKNSLVQQSFHAREIKDPLNGDGFGMGWYVQSISETPAVYTSAMPAWSDRNLRHLAPKVSSPCIFAHVRAASTGSVSQLNCQPFQYLNYLFMHNGEIRGFSQIKRDLRRRLCDEIYEWIEGETDSEHFFALFLNRLLNKQATSGASFVSETLLETLEELEQLKIAHAVDQPSSLNIVLTDGDCMVGLRYSTEGYDHVAPTLYYSSGKLCTCDNGISHMVTSSCDKAVLIVSEKLTDQQDEWHEVPVNHLIEINHSLSVTVKALAKISSYKTQ